MMFQNLSLQNYVSRPLASHRGWRRRHLFWHCHCRSKPDDHHEEEDCNDADDDDRDDDDHDNKYDDNGSFFVKADLLHVLIFGRVPNHDAKNISMDVITIVIGKPSKCSKLEIVTKIAMAIFRLTKVTMKHIYLPTPRITLFFGFFSRLIIYPI